MSVDTNCHVSDNYFRSFVAISQDCTDYQGASDTDCTSANTNKITCEGAVDSLNGYPCKYISGVPSISPTAVSETDAKISCETTASNTTIYIADDVHVIAKFHNENSFEIKEGFGSVMQFFLKNNEKKNVPAMQISTSLTDIRNESNSKFSILGLTNGTATDFISMESNKIGQRVMYVNGNMSVHGPLRPMSLLVYSTTFVPGLTMLN